MLSAHSQIGSTLQFGTRGGSVTELQQELTQLGYTLRDDGIFGKETRKRVIQFQKDSGLTQDGIVGNDTKGAIGRALQARIENEKDIPDMRIPIMIIATLVIGFLWWQS
jgi:peptidoglycan hydrolase-like protein with peptidoglycan-binding domain